MRRWLFIILGVLLVAGAAGAFIYRSQLAELAVEQTADGKAPLDAREARRGLQPAPNAADRPGGRGERTGRRGDNLRMAELFINVLNTIVGIVGIGLWIAGSRMRGQSQTQSQTQSKI